MQEITKYSSDTITNATKENEISANSHVCFEGLLYNTDS